MLTVIVPTVLCGPERWALSRVREALLGGFERKILRRIYGAVSALIHN
jgi:hypothetical protein